MSRAIALPLYVLAFALVAGCQCWEPCGSDPECVIGFDAGTDSAFDPPSDSGQLGGTDAAPEGRDSAVSEERSSCAHRCGGHGSEVPSGELCVCFVDEDAGTTVPLCEDFDEWCGEGL